MGDRPLDDNRHPRPAPPRDRQPGGYYYDDRTGYETYNPDDEDEEEEGDDARREKQQTREIKSARPFGARLTLSRCAPR